MQIRVAVAQMAISAEVAENVATIERAIDFAAAENADVLLTPEGSVSGYSPEFDPRVVSDAVGELASCAREVQVSLALGTCFVEPDRVAYNQIRFYDPAGEFLGFHAKILRCSPPSGPPRGEAANFAGAPLRTFDLNGVPVGGLICNDMWANPMCTPEPDPHLSQQLAAMGARVILHAVNGGRDGGEFSDLVWGFHESNLRMRARAGRIWIVTVDNCGPTDINCSAPSGVIGPDGEWLAKAPARGEHFFAHTIDLEEEKG